MKRSIDVKTRLSSQKLANGREGLDVIAKDLENRQHRKRQDSADDPPHPPPKNYPYEDCDGVKCETQSEYHRSDKLALDDL